MPNPPYPKNAPGDFYVEDRCCTACEAPLPEAPDMVVQDLDGPYPHCYFRRQPKTPEDIEEAISALQVSCVEALRYAGTDPKILTRLRDLGLTHLCDQPLDPSKEVPPSPQAIPPAVPEAPPTRPSLSSSDRSHPLWDRDLDI